MTHLFLVLLFICNVLCSWNTGSTDSEFESPVGALFSPGSVLFESSRASRLHTFSPAKTVCRKRVRRSLVEEEEVSRLTEISISTTSAVACSRVIGAAQTPELDLEVSYFNSSSKRKIEDEEELIYPIVKAARVQTKEEEESSDDDDEEEEDTDGDHEAEEKEEESLRDLPTCFRSESTRFFDAGAIARSEDAARSAGVTPNSLAASPSPAHLLFPPCPLINSRPNSVTRPSTAVDSKVEVEEDEDDPELNEIFGGFGFYDIENGDLLAPL